MAPSGQKLNFKGPVSFPGCGLGAVASTIPPLVLVFYIGVATYNWKRTPFAMQALQKCTRGAKMAVYSTATRCPPHGNRGTPHQP